MSEWKNAGADSFGDGWHHAIDTGDPDDLVIVYCDHPDDRQHYTGPCCARAVAIVDKIVKAVNLHDRLVDACEAVYSRYGHMSDPSVLMLSAVLAEAKEVGT